MERPIYVYVSRLHGARQAPIYLSIYAEMISRWR